MTCSARDFGIVQGLGNISQLAVVAEEFFWRSIFLAWDGVRQECFLYPLCILALSTTLVRHPFLFHNPLVRTLAKDSRSIVTIAIIQALSQLRHWPSFGSLCLLNPLKSTLVHPAASTSRQLRFSSLESRPATSSELPHIPQSEVASAIKLSSTDSSNSAPSQTSPSSSASPDKVDEKLLDLLKTHIELAKNTTWCLEEVSTYYEHSSSFGLPPTGKSEKVEVAVPSNSDEELTDLLKTHTTNVKHTLKCLGALLYHYYNPDHSVHYYRFHSRLAPEQSFEDRINTKISLGFALRESEKRFLDSAGLQPLLDQAKLTELLKVYRNSVSSTLKNLRAVLAHYESPIFSVNELFVQLKFTPEQCLEGRIQVKLDLGIPLKPAEKDFLATIEPSIRLEPTTEPSKVKAKAATKEIKTPADKASAVKAEADKAPADQVSEVKAAAGKSTMKRPADPSTSSAGSNWKALKKTLGEEAGSSTRNDSKKWSSASSQTSKKPAPSTRPTGVDASSAARSTNERGQQKEKEKERAPSKLPWFAEDISAEDLDLVRRSAEERMARSLQWEGIADMKVKKMAILGGLPDDASSAKREPGNYLAIDCEMVGVGHKGSESVLARVSIVNFHGATILDRFVKPQEKVTDYRTWVSGIRPKDLKDALPFAEVQAEVAALIKGKVLIGHAIQNDLRALLLSHPRPLIRDTAVFQPLRDIAKTKYPSLKKLAKLVLGIDIQLDGESHSSVEDARATMAVFRSQKSRWDELLRSKPGSLSHRNLVSQGTSKSKGNNKVWEAPVNGKSVNASSPALTRRSSTSTNTSTPEASGAENIRLKPKMAAQTDWWKESI